MKIVFGILAAGASGKISGNVAAKNRGGAYLRTWVKPTNPQSSYQQTVRNRMGVLSAAWRDLTDAQRADWVSWATSNPIIDRLGQSILLSGQQAYVKINTNRTIAGDAATASSTPGSPSYTSAIVDTTNGVTSSASGPTVIFDLGAGAAADQILFVNVSPVVSAGITNTNATNRLLEAHTITAGEVTATLVDVQALYVARFGAITAKAGDRINMQIREYDEGQLSSPVGITGIIGA